jgi:hypothetical protein
MADQLSCECPFCDDDVKGGMCGIESRVLSHMEAVVQLSNLRYRVTITHYNRVRYSPTVTLTVGQDGVRISCHKILLNYYSSFFDNAFYGDFKEDQIDELGLPANDAADISNFVVFRTPGPL